MVQIKFDIEGTEHSFEINPPRGDPNAAYNSQERFAEEVESIGYEFVDKPPRRMVLIRAHRKGRDDSVIDLGDISGKVDPIDESDTEEPPIDRTEDGEGETPDTGEPVELTLVDPDGQEQQRTYEETQNIGAVALDLKKANDIGRKKRVVIYRSRERQREFPNEAPLADMDGETLYWDLTDRR